MRGCSSCRRTRPRRGSKPSSRTSACRAWPSRSQPGRFSWARVWAFARREAIELRHDTVRLTFAIFGPLLLMIVFGYGISLDVEHLTFAVLDYDGTTTSRSYADAFRGS